jgi:hypothetical protein
MSTTAVMVDNKSDCQNGVAMIEAELKKEHDEVVLETLRKALSFTELNVEQQAWSECIKYIKWVRDVLRPTPFSGGGVEGNDQAKTSDDQAKASDNERAASDKPPCEQGRYWCAKRAECIKSGTPCRYLHSDVGRDRSPLYRH